MIELLVLWVLCGAAAFFIAEKKGRSGGAWFFVGLLLGPFGILFAAIASPNEKELEKRSIAFGTMRKCPMCAELVKSEAVKCRFCGAALAPEERRKPLEPGPGEFYCARCRQIRPISGSGGTIFGTRICSDCLS